MNTTTTILNHKKFFLITNFMANQITTSFLFLYLLAINSLPTATADDFNILTYGAKSDGRTDSATALSKAWLAACGSSGQATIYIPDQKFLISRVKFQGPCKSTKIMIKIDGTLVAPSDYASSGNDDWIAFSHVDGVSISGGIIDGQGKSLWSCKASGGTCPNGSSSLVFGSSRNVVVSNLTSTNSKLYHIVIHASCQRVTLEGLKITAPDNSPNTDGIHVQSSSEVTIVGSEIKTGDDCISVGQGTSGLWVERVTCGPGHGISIGSLGKDSQERGVQNVTVKSTTFTGSDNGLRIKTWARPSTGFVRGVVFEHSVMRNVKNPIIITQNYCPGSKDCPKQSSGIKISGVTYSDIQGSSATPVAVKLDCSPSNPCREIKLQNIKLVYGNNGQPATSSCKHATGTTSGFVIPPSCL